MADCCLVPVAFGAAWCLLGGCGGASTAMAASFRKGNRVHATEQQEEEDDERPRKMTPQEYEMYCLHMNAYGKHR